MITNVIVNTRFTAIHCWPACPINEVSYLKTPHRHEFHVVAKKKVTHNDRDIEIIMLKQSIDEFISVNWKNTDLGSMSCEMMCSQLMTEFNLSYVSVLEDGENGAEIYA